MTCFCRSTSRAGAKTSEVTDGGKKAKKKPSDEGETGHRGEGTKYFHRN